VGSVYCAISIESLYTVLLFVFKGTFAFAIRAFFKKQLVGVEDYEIPRQICELSLAVPLISFQ
jgi:hypothetical protein